MCACVCVYWGTSASGVLDVDCNQDHITLSQEVLQQRTGSRNTRTTSLVSPVTSPTANRSHGYSGKKQNYNGPSIIVYNYHKLAFVCMVLAGWYQWLICLLSVMSPGCECLVES